jgi:hypothetical protein
VVHIHAGLALAEVDTLSGKSDEAEHKLQALQDQTHSAGYLALAFRARLLLGEAELRSGKLAGARVRLDQLRADARSKGFVLIARQAFATTRAHGS